MTVLHYDGNGNVHWEPISYTYRAIETNAWNAVAARAYAAAILLFDRYLFVVGGMQENGSILHPLLLDTETWEFYYEHVTNDEDAPSARHGASIVDDVEKRGRLVMFGGGSGSDLLRSGVDNSEVWELNLNGCTCAADVKSSLPWQWKCIHRDQVGSRNIEDTQHAVRDDVQLSPAEQLNFGRCHASFRTGRDSVILAFGSGRPTCNSILGYRLNTDAFVRLNVGGKLPQARFTFASISMVDSGYILFHGGYCSHNAAETVDGMCVLDLAADMRRSFNLLPEVTGDSAVSFAPVTNQEVLIRQMEHRRSVYNRRMHMFGTYGFFQMGDLPYYRDDVEDVDYDYMDESSDEDE